MFGYPDETLSLVFDILLRNLALQLSSIFESEGILHGVEALASFLTLNGLNFARSRGEYAIISYFGLLVKL